MTNIERLIERDKFRARHRTRSDEFDTIAVWCGIVFVLVVAMVCAIGIVRHLEDRREDDAAARSAEKACLDRKLTPIVYHAGDGKVLGVSCWDDVRGRTVR